MKTTTSDDALTTTLLAIASAILFGIPMWAAIMGAA